MFHAWEPSLQQVIIMLKGCVLSGPETGARSTGLGCGISWLFHNRGPQAPRCWILEVAALNNQLQLESHLLCRMMSVMLQEEAFAIWNSLPTDLTNSKSTTLQERTKDSGKSGHKPIVLFDRPTTLGRPSAAFRNSIRLDSLWFLPG